MNPPRVASLGVHIVDILARPVATPPMAGGRHEVDEVRITAAGTAAGTGADLAKLGIETLVLGAIGDDDLGELLVQKLRRHAVDTTRLVRKQGLQTSVSILLIGHDGERQIVLRLPGANSHLSLEDIDFDAIAEADLLHVGGVDVLGDFAGEPLVEVMRFARSRGIPTSLDVLVSCDERTAERLAPAFQYADYFLPNAEQLQGMTGCSDPSEAAAALRRLGVGCVAATLGAEGSLVASDRGEARLPAFDVPVIDTTGCGDAYAAGFIVGVLSGWSEAAAGWLGTAAAALVVQGLGSDAGISDLDSTLAFLADRAPAEIATLARSLASDMSVPAGGGDRS
jgi:sugar/nucleoside kinase (ribokinase family)